VPIVVKRLPCAIRGDAAGRRFVDDFAREGNALTVLTPDICVIGAGLGGFRSRRRRRRSAVPVVLIEKAGWAAIASTTAASRRRRCSPRQDTPPSPGASRRSA
jgi:hypothetical protein